MQLDNPLISFDIGGTWFRSALLNESFEELSFNKVPSINYTTNPNESAESLQIKLVDFLVIEIERIVRCTGLPVDTAVISLGAAINVLNGVILNSGPLWGPECKPFALLEMLNIRSPSINWHIYNDISATLMYHTLHDNQLTKKSCLLTVSSGIGMRIYDASNKKVPCCSQMGLQGEIGHLPIDFSLFGKQLEMECDCGGKNHLNAFCSGRGLDNILKKLPALIPESSIHDIESIDSLHKLRDCLRNNNTYAEEILKQIVSPIAHSILWILTIDPQLEVIFITGGLYEYLGDFYSKELISQLEYIGMYQTSEYIEDYFSSKLKFSNTVQHAGLIGAAYCLNLKDEVKVY
ncbi:ROK family protein [Vibrio sp. OCN044]|uniref:ROK family protein n=1 Tax=Vibrio tetraodonis subsp. pristinus TaxID=2695891 RepID=A0A6L8LT81_9VIBR|nr:ROK family protein [Vibrio tetraodonis]MYM59301.1 ROK family protein [Vibrio tetraodonis subsp. pristinus]